ncbi:MAG TPA: hypothetical protein VNI20_01505, partial [Fimbriimonadaceae bacterium]|nr:hypothetical protein [Fimbriimonadaceae bacterium]
PDPTIVNGQETLNAEVRAKHGQISINGSATVGDAVDPSVTMKGTLDGTYVSDGWTGNQGANSVFSDNGTNHSYDLQSLDITYPIISGIGAQEYTDPNGTVWTDQQTYYDNEAMVVPVSQITSSTSAFAYADLNGNSISYVPATATTPATLSVKGIVKVKGDLEIKVKGGLKYNGRGTLYATQDIYVGSNLLPSAGLSFPKDSAIGLVAGRNMNLATGAGDAQISMAGAFYAMGTITSAKQNQILGTFVANYFDMGKNVPNIYQVPSLRQNLPPGMPGDQLYLTLNVKSWRERK